jgi:hypothetical protein
MFTAAKPWVDKLINTISREAWAFSLERQYRKGREGRHIYTRGPNVTANSVTGSVFVTGPYVEQTALDLEFTVPPGGYKPGDVDPYTGEPFPTAVRRDGSVGIVLEDKGISAGEAIPVRKRVYNRVSGITRKRKGFLTRALDRYLVNIYSREFSTTGYILMYGLARDICVAIGMDVARQIEKQAAARGASLMVDRKLVISIDNRAYVYDI